MQLSSTEVIEKGMVIFPDSNKDELLKDFRENQVLM